MARYSNYNAHFRRIEVDVPHTVCISVPRDEAEDKALKKDMNRWIRDGDRVGYFRVDELKFRYRFHFSDENTALEFKIRFG
jgi:hypothetical protein